MVNGYETQAPTKSGATSSNGSKAVVYKTTAVLWSTVGIVVTGILATVINTMLVAPGKEVDDLKIQMSDRHLGFENRLTAFRQLTLSHGKAIDMAIPSEIRVVREEIQHQRGITDALRSRLEQLIEKDQRPDPATGTDLRRAEDRVNTRITFLLQRIERLEGGYKRRTRGFGDFDNGDTTNYGPPD